MKIRLFIVLLLGFSPVIASPLKNTINGLESEWAHIYYGTPKAQQALAYQQLLEKTVELAKQFPDNPDLLYWQAVIKANYAEYQSELVALDTIHEVRDLLQKVIAIDPKTMEGSAYVVLGTLYYLTPPWPIAFGDDDKANELLQTALKINPDGIDSNYFYGNYLLSEDHIEEAEKHFTKAIAAPVRPEQVYVDNELKKEAKTALETMRQHKNERSKKALSSLFMVGHD
ncbi:MAG: hypothetical protein PHR16_12105 [Methylovulum sp.]|nr:hypothetical protein [Methylovulum sp.]